MNYFENLHHPRILFSQIHKKRPPGSPFPGGQNRHTHTHTHEVGRQLCCNTLTCEERLLAAYVGLRPSIYPNVQSILKISSSLLFIALGTWKSRRISGV
jgi:hypothetical protein